MSRPVDAREAALVSTLEMYLDEHGGSAATEMCEDWLSDVLETLRGWYEAGVEQGYDDLPECPAEPRGLDEASRWARAVTATLDGWRGDVCDPRNEDCDCRACRPTHVRADHWDTRCTRCCHGRGRVVCQACQSAALVTGLRASVREVA